MLLKNSGLFKPEEVEEEGRAVIFTRSYKN